MNTYSGQRRPHYILLVLFVIAILLDRFLIAGLFPLASGLAGVNPMVVFLDIPVQFPVIIDLPVIGIFFLFYFILLLSYPSRYGASTWQGLRKRLWGVATGALAILLCMAAGGGIYYLCSGLLSREVRNGIDSFGIQADLYTPIPDHEIIHMRGGMILLVCFLIGLRIFIKRTNLPADPAMTGRQAMEAELSGIAVDPRIAGFQEKRGSPAEREFAELLKQKRAKGRETGEREVAGSCDVERMRPRTAATSVAVVAPLRADIS